MPDSQKTIRKNKDLIDGSLFETSTFELDAYVADTFNTPAKGIGISGEPIFAGEEAKQVFTDDGTGPTYNGESVTVVCSPCQFNCDGNCAPFWRWSADEKRCVKDLKCP